MSRRFQFSLRALLVAMLVVAAFFGGMALQWRIDHHPLSIEASATYDSDGAGGLQFELMIEGSAKAKKQTTTPARSTVPRSGAQQ